jgi:alcohol dehydrogenase
MVPLLDMYRTGMTFMTGRVNAREAIPSVLRLVQEKKLRPELFTTLVAGWEDAPQAMMERTTKVVIKR